MKRMLLVGFDPAVVAWLAERLPDIGVEAADEPTRDALGRGAWCLLVLNQQGASPGIEAVVARLRGELGQAEVPAIALLAHAAGHELAQRLVSSHGVCQVLFQPLDREELLRQAAALLKVTPTRPAPADGSLQAAMASLWHGFHDATMQRVALIESANRALLRGTLDDELERQAEREAHKLRGSLGTFGFAEGSRLATEIERLLQPGPLAQPERGLRLSQALIALRHELAGPPMAPPSSGGVIEGQANLLVVDDDGDLATLIAQEAEAHGLAVRKAANLSAARRAIVAKRPDAVVLDLSLAETAEDGRVLLAELTARTPPVPVLVLTGRDDLLTRVEIARLGASAYLHKPMPASQVLEAVDRVLKRRKGNAFRIMALDDDPSVLASLQALLSPRGIQVTCLSDPFAFWQKIEEARPELLVLDVDIPFISGIELCRVVRNDPRWSELPILFLTARRDADTIQRIFDAGADDFVSKPIVGPEVLTRITNRLERTRLFREMAETDALTGVATRHKALQVIGYLTQLADRQKQALSLAVVDLDHFKSVNDRHGHLAGDKVLRRFGALLQGHFRGADVLARWGGEEFLLGLYGASRQEAVKRLEALLELLKAEVFVGDHGETFQTSFSAGVAEFPRDGHDVQALFMEADAAMYRAKTAGRGRVFEVEAEREGAV